jgi:hypothetical protein
VQWAYENIPEHARYQRIWSHRFRGEWVHYDCSWDGPSAGVENVTLSEPDRLHSGEWELRILIDGEEILRQSVSIREGVSYWCAPGLAQKCRGEKSCEIP